MQLKLLFLVRTGYVHLGSQGCASGTYTEDIWSTSLWSHSRNHGTYYNNIIIMYTPSLLLPLSLSLFLSPPLSSFCHPPPPKKSLSASLMCTFLCYLYQTSLPQEENDIGPLVNKLIKQIRASRQIHVPLQVIR